MDKNLISIFEEMEEISREIDKIDNTNRQFINLYEHEEESDNPIVIENLKKKDIYYKEYNYMKNIAENLVNVDPLPKGLKVNNFIKDTRNIQERLDYINEKLKVQIVLDGTRELFTGLAYSSVISSYSPFNLYYIEYKFPLVFGQDIILIYEDEYEKENLFNKVW